MSADQTGTGNRPLSPHLQVYRWQWTMALSILHRATGLALTVGALLMVFWLLALATGPDSFAGLQAFLGSWFGRLLLFGWTWALAYHFLNGIRHLVWDAGKGFDRHRTFSGFRQHWWRRRHRPWPSPSALSC